MDVGHDLGFRRVVVHEIDEIVFGDRDELLGLTPREGDQEHPARGPGETEKQRKTGSVIPISVYHLAFRFPLVFLWAVWI